MATLTPIETEYGGVRFRSRKEARWAVFFDTLRIRWEYEPEGFELPSGARYLPDFWLPGIQGWFEVKGEECSEADRERWEEFGQALPEGQRAFLHYGEISVDSGWAGNSIEVSWNQGWDNLFQWCECPGCSAIGIEYMGRAERIGCKCTFPDKTINNETPRLAEAYSEARGYRFWDPK